MTVGMFVLNGTELDFYMMATYSCALALLGSNALQGTCRLIVIGCLARVDKLLNRCEDNGVPHVLAMPERFFRFSDCISASFHLVCAI